MRRIGRAIAAGAVASDPAPDAYTPRQDYAVFMLGDKAAAFDRAAEELPPIRSLGGGARSEQGQQFRQLDALKECARQRAPGRNHCVDSSCAFCHFCR